MHQYIDRRTQQVCTERLLGDRIVRALYSPLLESAPWVTRAASAGRFSKALAFLSYDSLVGQRATGTLRFVEQCGVDLSECVEPPSQLNTARKIFERQIRYWECRPLPRDESTVTCAADARVIVGSLHDRSMLFVKEKFFDYEELLGADQHEWLRAFRHGDFAVFRLTPEKYHYTHLPVAGVIEDLYEIHGRYHSCNPAAVFSGAWHSKNRRLVTIIQTDLVRGTGVGLVAIIEVVALMVGQIVQCYSREGYAGARELTSGMFVERGQPKSLFRPGSSTVILLFQKDRVKFCEDLLLNRGRSDAQSRFSIGFEQSAVETDVAVRSPLGHPITSVSEREDL